MRPPTVPRVELSVSTSLLAFRISLVTSSIETWLARDDVLHAGEPVEREFGVVWRRRTAGVGGSDVDVAVAQDAGLRDGGGGVGVQVLDVFAAHAHGDLNRCWVCARERREYGDVADGDAFERDGGAALQAAGVIKVSAKGELVCEQAARWMRTSAE